MKDVRNAKLRKILDKIGIKDVVLNFDQGYVSVWSEDDLIDTILHYGDNTIETRSFSDFPIDYWVKLIKDIFDDAMEHYERHLDYEKNKGDSVIKLG